MSETAINRERFATDLATLVGFPSVSSDPANGTVITEMAQFAAGLLDRAGLKAEIVSTDGNPLVYARHDGPAGSPTVRIYNHLDVQPANPDEWRNGLPFRMVDRDDTFHGRGTTDDKGPALVALYAAEQAIQAGTPLGFEFVWETGEEIGSPHFGKALDGLQSAGKLAEAASALVSDTLWDSATTPTIIYGLRGLLGAEIQLTTTEQDVHSGIVGGLAVNPANQLAAIISSMTDGRTGRVLIPGFYDGVTPVPKEEIDQLAEGFSVAEFQRTHGLHVVAETDARAAARAIMTEPSLDVHSIASGHIVDQGIQTVIPNSAVAQLSARLVPGQTPEAVFAALQAHVAAQNSLARVTLKAAAEPFLTDIHGPHIAAITAAYRDLGLEPICKRLGGSIGAAIALAKFSKAVVLAGLSLPTDSYHGPNETFSWSQAALGMKLFTHYFERIATIPAD